MKVIILAGGFGTRLQEETGVKPKPMVEIGGYPMLWHIMNIYAAYGHREFILALGYKSEVIKNYFLNYHYLSNDISVNLKSGDVSMQNHKSPDWLVHLVDTGLQTQTGGRLKRLGDYVQDGTFMMTYGDGVADIDIQKLVDFHVEHGKLATVTAVRPPARFGGITLDDDRVASFKEKPQIGEGWINGGFFVLEPGVLDYINGDDILWEHEPMEKLVRDDQLVAYRHDRFWQGMDTLRDVRHLESYWSEGKAPWKIW
jgi:glucose-1-phosphate cytidylyltransferase